MQLPYVLATGVLTNVLKKITEAQQPPRFTQDFLSTKLGFESGSARPVIPFLKKIGFLSSDGTPTSLYSRYRNPNERGKAAAEGLRAGFREIFERNEYAQNLTRDKFKNLVIEITGLEDSDQVVRAIVGSFFALRDVADFDAQSTPAQTQAVVLTPQENATSNAEESDQRSRHRHRERVGLNLSYTINLNLPETRDIDVFNAIFKSLKEHMLKDEL